MVRRRTVAGDMAAMERCNRKIARRAKQEEPTPMIHPCGSCLRAEFADDDYEGDEMLVVAPGGKIGHLKRPGGSEGTGGGLTWAVRAARGAQTYCGHPITDGWTEVSRWYQAGQL